MTGGGALSRQRRAMAMGLVFAGGVAADEFPPYPADPFDTLGSVSATPARPAGRPGPGDPCRTAGGEPAVWTLAGIIDQALCHNPQTRQTWANARFQAAQMGVAEAAYLPTFTVTTSFSRSENSSSSNLQTIVQTTGTTGQNVQQTRITPTVSLNYLLFDFGNRAAKLENARLALAAANWTHAATLQNVLFSVVQAYYQWFATQAALEAAVASERSNGEAFQAAAYRYEVGAAALADQLQAQTSYAQAKLNRQQAAGNAQIALGTLANAMGLTPEPSLRVEPPDLNHPGELPERDVRALMEEAKSLRPDLAAAEAQVRAAAAGVDSARAGSLPTLSLVGNYTYGDIVGVRSLQSWAVGVQVSVPLFTGFSNTYQIRGAEQQVAVQEANRDKLDQSVALDVWRAFFNLQTTRETLHSTDELLASANQAERVALGRYQAGAGNIVELLNAEASLANARFQQVQARYNWYIGKAQLAQAMGRLDLDTVQPARPGGAVR